MEGDTIAKWCSFHLAECRLQRWSSPLPLFCASGEDRLDRGLG